MTAQPDKTSRITAERVTIRGSVRWALTDRGRIIIQFADDQDLQMAIALWRQGPEFARHEVDGSTLEFQLPESAGP